MKIITTEVGRFRYYILMPLERFLRRTLWLFRQIADVVTGRWYCKGCEIYHGPRIVAYYEWDEGDGMCHKHITPCQVKAYDKIWLGNQNVTYRVKDYFLAITKNCKFIVSTYPREEVSDEDQIINSNRSGVNDACKACPLRDDCDFAHGTEGRAFNV